MGSSILEYVLYLVILVALAIPLGSYIGKIMNGEKVFLSRVVSPVERGIYCLLGVREEEEMNWKKYALSVAAFSIIGFWLLFLILLLQGYLPWNPQHIGGMSPALAFNTAVSFVTNTNWQAYSGEVSLSYFSQMVGLTTQNFVSAAVGICVLFALIRGFIKVRAESLGNFWVDLTRTVLYVLLPMSILVTMLLVSNGVVQSMNGYETAHLLEPAVFEDGKVVAETTIPMGPAASQIAIKQLGTNGGGFFGTNSAFPLENPTAFTNLVEMLSILLIPVSLCFTFGRNVKDKRQGIAIFSAMLLILVLALTGTAIAEQKGTPALAQAETASAAAGETRAADKVNAAAENQIVSGGNMEGKEARFGVPASVTWSVFTTAASNGSVNAMHDSYTPLGGAIPMLLMMLGEVIFGGAGCGLYGMLGFAIMTVFIAGLMVGRTPEYLGKKIEPYEMKMACVVTLVTPVAVLSGSGIAAVWPSTAASLNNEGAHGLSELLYTFASAGGNNGSAFAGFHANTMFFNLMLGAIMVFARFAPLLATLAIAGNLAGKKKVAVTAGTLSTSNGMFVGLLIFVVLLIGALSFFPALSLGPIAEYFEMAR